MTKNGHPLSGLSCDHGKVDLAIHQSCGSSKVAFLDMGKIHGNKLVFHGAANIQELITFTLKTPGLSTARPHLPEAPNVPLFDISPPLFGAPAITHTEAAKQFFPCIVSFWQVKRLHLDSGSAAAWLKVGTKYVRQTKTHGSWVCVTSHI